MRSAKRNTYARYIQAFKSPVRLSYHYLHQAAHLGIYFSDRSGIILSLLLKSDQILLPVLNDKALDASKII